MNYTMIPENIKTAIESQGLSELYEIKSLVDALITNKKIEENQPIAKNTHQTMDSRVEQMGISIINLEGDLDIYNSADLQGRLTSNMNQGNRLFILNFSRLNYVDSAGVGVIVSAFSRLNEINGEIVFVDISQNVKKIFVITKLIKFFKVFQSDEEAIHYFSSPKNLEKPK